MFKPWHAFAAHPLKNITFPLGRQYIKQITYSE